MNDATQAIQDTVGAAAQKMYAAAGMGEGGPEPDMSDGAGAPGADEAEAVAEDDEEVVEARLRDRGGGELISPPRLRIA